MLVLTVFKFSGVAHAVGSCTGNTSHFGSSTSDATWCGSALQTTMGEYINLGNLSTYLSSTNDCSSKLSLISTTNWNSYKEVYRGALATSEYLPAGSSTAWTSSSNGSAVNYLDTTGSASNTSAPNAACRAVLPTVILDQSDFCVVSGTGTINDPYLMAEYKTCLATPATPASLTLNPTSYYNNTTSITISWSGTTGSTYVLERATDGGTSYTQIYSGTTASYTDTTAKSQTQVRYRVKAYIGVTANESAYATTNNISRSACNSACTTCTGSASSNCSACASGYYLSSTTCTACSTGCAVCTNASTCATCASGYSKVGNSCISTQATMQGWTGCSALAKPGSASYTAGPTLTDARDGKTYQIRKFADGKCWMVENLRYGGTTTASGTTDYCKSKTGSYTKGYTDGTKNTGWYGRVGTNATGTGTVATLYGDCRDPATTNTAPCTTGSTACGYLYNWQAAMQLASAYSDTSVSYPSGTPTTTNYIQGICPTGWHLPSGGTSNTDSEFVALDIANGGDGSNGQTENSYPNFWKPDSTTSTGSNDWNGLYSGYVGTDGTFYDQGKRGDLWSSRESSSTSVYVLHVWISYVYPAYTYYPHKASGYAVRCIKD